MKLLTCLFLLWLSATSWAAESRPIATTPFLRLETGMHTAPIRGVSLDAAARYVVTASDDKTARVWDMATGKLLQTLRPPLGFGYEGSLYAVAMSPDGQQVATGGWTGRDGSYQIYLFNRATGQLTRSVSLPSTMNHLAYSRNGQYLAVALFGGSGVRVFRSSDLTEVARDSDYGDRSNWLDFDAQGRLVSSCYDGYVRLYDTTFKLIAKTFVAGGKQPQAVSFSPDGRKIAVGFNDSQAVAVVSASDLSWLYAPDLTGVNNGNLETVAWSADGDTLYAGGRHWDNAYRTHLLSWSNAGRTGHYRDVVIGSTITAIQPLADARVVYGAQDPLWGVLARDGGKLLERQAGIVDQGSITMAGFLSVPMVRNSRLCKLGSDSTLI